MLRIAPTFDVHSPTSLDEALALLARHHDRARLIAGGTDLLPNLKHGLDAPEVLINLKSLPGLDQIEIGDETIRLGALVSLHAIAGNEQLAAILPSLTAAAGQIAGPQHRRMGTLGGNICLDTRCVYINQTYFWRESLGFCIKKDGTACHVTGTGRKCVAAASNDTAPVLMTLGASVGLSSASGIRTLELDDFYVNDGVENTSIAADEILTHVEIRRPPVTRRMAFEKLRIRGSIDFPMVNLALAFDLVEGRIEAPSLVVSAIAARPRRIKGLPTGPLDDALIEAFAQAAFKQTRPLTNINGDVVWRREMVPVMVERAFRDAVEREA